MYEGEWNGVVRHGQGVLKWPDGSVYDGQWQVGTSCQLLCYICSLLRITCRMGKGVISMQLTQLRYELLLFML